MIPSLPVSYSTSSLMPFIQQFLLLDVVLVSDTDTDVVTVFYSRNVPADSVKVYFAPKCTKWP